MFSKSSLSFIAVVVLAFAFPFVVHAYPAEGRWSGRLDAPGNAIDITVDLERAADGSWHGSIDIPAQGLTGFPLSEISVEGAAVEFAMAIPGDPVFRAELSPDGAALSGALSQGGAVVPFQLERTGDAEIEAQSLASTVPPEVAAELVGRWQGTLDIPGQSLRLALVLATAPDGTLTATLDSPDQGQTGMPVSRLTVEGETVRAELTYLGAVFEGTLDAARKAMTGSWRQGGGSLPLTLQRVSSQVEGVGAGSAEAFPPVDAASVGISDRALELLAERVQRLVDNEEIVGGELVVIKNRRTVFREAFGWQDRDADQPLEVDSIYCVRSMTKPLVGTAIQMLIDEGRLRLDTPVREILPSFAGPKTGKITVEHLLTHTGGLPLSTIGRPLTEYSDLAAVVAEAAAAELEFEPGSRFEYSDAGSDTLGAIVATITGAPVEQFLQERILEPLGMDETITLLGDDAEVLARVPSAYSGGTGSWSEHWEPTDPPIFPIFLTSQSLYSTTSDYARFLALWMDGGRVGEKRLLSSEAVERALEPNEPIHGYPPSFGGLDVYYGQQWIVYAKEAGGAAPQRILFGHDGSDGTHAWAWPELDLMVLFFTQSRGTLAGVGLQDVVQAALVEQALDAPALARRIPSAEELEQVTGLYWDETNNAAYYVITRFGDRLMVERPGQMLRVFEAGDVPGRFYLEGTSQAWIEFVRAGDGAVIAMRHFFGGQIELDPRHAPEGGLPSAEAVIASVERAHRLDRLLELGAVRLSGTLLLEVYQMEGKLSTVFDATRERTEIAFEAVKEIAVALDGRAWSYTTPTGLDELEGPRREQALLRRLAVRFGDWSEHYEQVEVLKRLQNDDGPVLLVRVVPREAPGTTMFVDEMSGRVLRTDALEQIPGMGVVGVETGYEDFRDVGGMQLPFRSVSKYSSSRIGRVIAQVKEWATGVEVPPEVFAPPSAPDQ